MTLTLALCTEILWGTLAGGAVLFVWGAVCWMALGHHFGDWKALDQQAGVDEALARSTSGPGLYAIPHWDTYAKGLSDPALRERMKKGPNAHVVVLVNCMESPLTFLKGALLQFAVAAALASLLYGGVFAVTGLLNTVVLFAALGALTHLIVPAQHAIWMGYPWRPVLSGLFDGVVGFALLGLVLHLLR